jgi:serine protease AprX
MDKRDFPSSRDSQDARRPKRSQADQQNDSDKRDRRAFTPDVLDKTVIAIPLLDILKKEEEAIKAGIDMPKRHPIIIDLNLEFPGGRQKAREEVLKNLIPQAIKNVNARRGPRIDTKKSKWSQQYLFGEMEAAVIRELVRLDTQDESEFVSDSTQRVGGRRAIYRIWPDFEFEALTTRSISTVKADAARNAFGALGEGIVWAVIDSGIDDTHPHFLKHQNLKLTGLGVEGEETSLQHQDFTRINSGPHTALQDRYGHGTHVAGIIAGELIVGDDLEDNKHVNHVEDITAEISYRDQLGKTITKPISPPIKTISGMAPKCKLLSLKVLDDKGKDPGRETPKGKSSNIIAAIEYIQEINGYGRRLFVHGVNMSVGYEFEPKWFACGQSPLCVEVDRLVRSGVVVVVASGNTGYGITQISATKTVSSGLDLSINDPGNAELAITVGSTHREMPHVYGVSYFSSKGPTGDGRLKPDLIAPGEKVISCDSYQRRLARDPESAAGVTAAASAQASSRATANPEPTPAETDTDEGTSTSAVTVTAATATASSGENPIPAQVHGRYREDSGTSMAAPHVSGVIAAFLSVRREFIGQAERVKEIFLSTATDLRRDRTFQGHGLVDLMRAIQSV